MGDGTSQRRPRHPQHLFRVRQDRLSRAAPPLAGNTPEEWGFRDENMTTPIRGAALPMGFNRQPHYSRGLLLVGDAGGMVNPFNGEGIAYAMESADIAAESIAEAHYRGAGTASAERALQAYPIRMKQRWAATTPSAGSS